MSVVRHWGPGGGMPRGRARKTSTATLWSPGATEGHCWGAPSRPAALALRLRSSSVRSTHRCFSFQCLSLSLAPGKETSARRTLHSAETSSGRKRSGSYDEMSESRARFLLHLVPSLYKSRDLRGTSELAPVIAVPWSPGEVRTDEDLSNYLIHRSCRQSTLVLTSRSDSLNIIS